MIELDSIVLIAGLPLISSLIEVALVSLDKKGLAKTCSFTSKMGAILIAIDRVVKIARKN